MKRQKAGRHSARVARSGIGPMPATFSMLIALPASADQSSSSAPDSGGMGRLAGGLPKAARSQRARSGPSVTSTKMMMIRAIFRGRSATKFRAARLRSARRIKQATSFPNSVWERPCPSDNSVVR